MPQVHSLLCHRRDLEGTGQILIIIPAFCRRTLRCTDPMQMLQGLKIGSYPLELGHRGRRVQVFSHYAVLHRGVSEFIWTAMLKVGWAGCVWEVRCAEGHKRPSKPVHLLDNCANREHSITWNSSASYLHYINATDLVERSLTTEPIKSILNTDSGVRH